MGKHDYVMIAFDLASQRPSCLGFSAFLALAQLQLVSQQKNITRLISDRVFGVQDIQIITLLWFLDCNRRSLFHP